MNDLISRQAAIDAVVGCTNCGTEDELRAYVTKYYLDNGWTDGIVDALDAIEQLPSTQPEQPEIIHCRDCENWDKTWTNDFSPNYHYCPMVDGVRKDNFYCADAERRTDDKTNKGSSC